MGLLLRALIITSNKSFIDWGEVFGDQVLDIGGDLDGDQGSFSNPGKDALNAGGIQVKGSVFSPQLLGQRCPRQPSQRSFSFTHILARGKTTT